MRKNWVSNKLFVGMFAVVFVVVAMIFAMPVATASALVKKDNFEKFYSSYMHMISTYDNHEGGVSVSSLDENESVDSEQDDITRIIVDSDKKIVDKDAIYSCSFNGTYFLQYETAEDATRAYEKYANSNFNVIYDYDVTTDALEPDEVEEEGRWSTSSFASSKYNSWGWYESTNFMGAVPYLTNLSAAVGVSNFNKVVVAVLDSGINTSHNLFAGRILLDYGRNFTAETVSGYTFEDRNGHGTHVSGTIAEITPSSVSILPLKVLNSEGKGKVSYIVSALQYMTEVLTLPEGYSLRVANMSLGVESSVPSSNLVSYINKAYNQGITCVVSAGNEQQDTANVEPANVANVITVSALTRNNYGGTKVYFDASYSNYGAAVKFAAPGTSILSAYIRTDYQSAARATATLSGTSMAAPHVTAIVALVLTNPNYADLKKGELLNFLKQNVDNSKILTPNPQGAQFDLDDADGAWNQYYGYGVINIENLGMTVEGEVTFSVLDENQETDFNLVLSYDIDSSAEIYYTTDENVSASQLTKDSEEMVKYTEAIHVTKSTKITAIAYVYGENNAIVQRSATSSKTYYVDNYDIESNYAVSSNGTITSYYGSLTTLKVQTSIGGVTIKTIGGNVFTSKVVTITLPSTITLISENAFYINTSLQTVNLQSATVEIGKCAFFKCTKLATINTENVTKLGDGAFAYTLVTDYNLSRVTTIGNNTFSASQINKVFFGQSLASIGTQTQVYNLEKVYGYASTTDTLSVAETFASKYNARFYDLTLRITQDFATKKVVKYGNSLTLQLKINGYNILSGDVAVNIVQNEGTLAEQLLPATSVILSSSLLQDDDTSYTLTLQTKSTLTVGEYALRVTIRDTVTSRSGFKVVVVSLATQEYSIVRIMGGDNYQIVVDEEIVDSSFKLYDGQTYSIAVISEDGYEISNVVINSLSATEGENVDVTVHGDVAVQANSEELHEFIIHFTSAHGTVYVGTSAVSSKSVDRNEDLSFTIQPGIGYMVKRVVANGDFLTSTGGVYTILDVTGDYEVEIVYEKAVYSIELTYVNACGSCFSSGELNEVDHGETKVITIVAYDGYVLDSVTVNGENVTVGKDGTFELTDVDENKDVVVSFRKAKFAMFGGESAVVLDYFFVFGGMFVAFIVARVVLFFVRKYKKEKKRY